MVFFEPLGRWMDEVSSKCRTALDRELFAPEFSLRPRRVGLVSQPAVDYNRIIPHIKPSLLHGYTVRTE